MNTQFSKKDTNIVKGVAIIAMLFHHCYVTNINFKAHGVSFAPLSKGTVVTLSLWAKVCVGIFVFLSAYGITISLKSYMIRINMRDRIFPGLQYEECGRF